MLSTVVCTLYAILFTLVKINAEVLGNIQNVKVTCSIDVSSYVVKNKYSITFQNIGAKSADEYLFMKKDHLAFINFENANFKSLSFYTLYEGNHTTYVIKLDTPLKPKGEYTINIKLIYASKLMHATKYSKFGENHSFKWKGNANFYSQYFTRTYNSVIITDPIFNRNIQTSIINYVKDGNNYIYHEQNIKPFSYNGLIFMFECPLPVFSVKKLNRHIYVSHYGKILIQDNVILQNAGPKLKGHFHNTEPDFWMYTEIPQSAENIKFFDIIGNSSKSKIQNKDDRKIFKFVPRYSLLQGGWKSTYTLQYEVPIYEFVFKEKWRYYIKILALDHILDDVVIENADIEIILPDGATVFSTLVPLGFQKRNCSKIYTSLSVFGRERICLQGKFLVEEHIKDVIIKYRYNLFNFFTAPFFITLLLEIMFLIYIFWERYLIKIQI